jgi:hypothetical protein
MQVEAMIESLNKVSKIVFAGARCLGRRPGLGYLWLVEGVVPARVVHRKAVAALGPGFAAGGFARREASAGAVWQRRAGQEFIVGWVQPTRSPDTSGWYGSRFIIEFRRGAEPRAGVLGPGSRFCQLLDDAGRERVRHQQNAVIRRLPPAPAPVLRTLPGPARDAYLAHGRPVTEPYAPDHDVWFRYRDERDLDAWFRLLTVLLPAVLGAVRASLGLASQVTGRQRTTEGPPHRAGTPAPRNTGSPEHWPPETLAARNTGRPENTGHARGALIRSGLALLVEYKQGFVLVGSMFAHDGWF